MLLAIDTSTSDASVAFVAGSRLLAEVTWEVGQRHSVELLDRLRWLLESRSAGFGDLTGIAVATGPGSFNGVRVALTVAKSLAYTLDVPLYGHPTLDVMAWGYAQTQGSLWALLEAGRGQVYAASYSAPVRDAAGWAPVDGYHILTPEELAARVTGPALLCADVREETRAAIVQALSERARFTSALNARRASWLAELALPRVSSGAGDDPRALEPLYLRRPAITKSAKIALPYSETHRAEGPLMEPGGEGEPRALRR
ncbi:MAG TPA: tRNA (adenosine(37)-N6)-threonylcarbamoyltransferase complex dimerization subunit type 1 TsaB [Ktedonobacterales bacterium]|nr:tRNA (adenosine(37)-N6)-threonylcarbamoyltransferase complex dimerization subunit type 1 TsaB [Ktedonobacterales bacterium]